MNTALLIVVVAFGCLVLTAIDLWWEGNRWKL